MVLSRKAKEDLLIGSDIVVTVLSIKGDSVRLGVTAPKSVEIDRREVRESKDRDRENGAAPQ